MLLNEDVAVLSAVARFCDTELLLDDCVGSDGRDLLIPNIEEKAALILFRVALAS